MARLLFASLVTLALSACAGSYGSTSHVENDPGGASVGGAPGGGSGAVSNDRETHASGAMNGFGAANGDPVANTGNLGSGSSESDPMNGVNQIGPAAPF